MSLVEAVFVFWGDLFQAEAPAPEAITGWVRDILVGAHGAMLATHETVAALSADDGARVSVQLNGLKVETTLVIDPAKPAVEVKTSALFALGVRRGCSPAWARTNPIGPFLAAKAKFHSGEVEGFLDFAVSKVSARILAAVQERLADGRWLMSGVRASDLVGARIDVAAIRAREARLDISSSRASWSAPGHETLVNVELRRALIEAPPPNRSQSFAEDDDLLVEEMRKLILGGKADSALAAARIVAPEARRRHSKGKRRPNDLISVIERLRRRYGAKYPVYTKI